MNKKKWLVIALALLIFFISSMASSSMDALIPETKSSLSEWESIFLDSGEPEYLANVVQQGDPTNQIAILHVDGLILETSSIYSDGYHHKAFLQSLDDITSNPTIKAVLLEVNSPGGGSYESAEIHKEIKEMLENRQIPLFVSMKNLAASGGYYISAPATKIYATPETLTGSIGVIMSGLNFSGFMEDWGIDDTTVKSGELKDMGAQTNPVSDQERAVLQGIVNESYERFLGVVAEGRKMDKNVLRPIADGRIYTSNQALEVGLIDAIGFPEEALQDLKTEYGLGGAQVVSYDLSTGGIGNILGMTMQQIGISTQHENHLDMLQVIQQKQYDRPMYMYGGGVYAN